MGIKDKLISFLWGFAEASFFFIVPDVWLGHIAIKYQNNKRQIILNIVISLVGALCGGAFLYMLAQNYSETIYTILSNIPAISENLIASVQTSLASDASASLSIIKGGVTGVPFKIFAYWAALSEMTLLFFLAVGFCARLLRFAAFTGFTYGAAKTLSKRYSKKSIYTLYFSAWIIFYSIYFTLMGL